MPSHRLDNQSESDTSTLINGNALRLTQIRRKHNTIYDNINNTKQLYFYSLIHLIPSILSLITVPLLHSHHFDPDDYH